VAERIEFDADVVRSHIEMLHELAAGIDGILPLCVYGENPDTKRKLAIVQHFLVGDVEGMTAAALAYAGHPDANVYAPLAVMRRNLGRGEKGSERDVIATLGAVTDDDADAGRSARSPVGPNYVLQTSAVPAANRQGFILFDRALPLAEAKPLLEALSRASGGDHGTKDASHVWRVPGTANWPNAKKVRERGRPRDPQPVTVLQPWDGTLTSVDDLRRVLGASPGGERPQANGLGPAAPARDVAEIMSRLGAGLRKLIKAPPIEGEDRSETIASVIASMIRAGLSDAEIVAVIEVHPEGIGAKHADRDDLGKEVARCREKFGAAEALGKTLTEQLLAGRPAPSAAAPQDEFDATPWTATDPKRLPRRQWLYGRHYIRQFVTATISPGGIGKTSLVLAEAVAMVTGRPILGVPVESTSRVWVWNGEDPMEELQRRILAICLHYGISQSELDGLFLDSGRSREICIAKELRGGAVVSVPDYDKVLASVERNRIDVVVIDPFVSSHRVNENDNNSIDLVAKAWARIADEANCSVELVHHARKTGGDEVTVEHARGAVALISAARSARALNSMSEDEEAKIGHQALGGVRKQFFRIDNGKANLALPPNRSRWIKMETVTLPNGSGGLIDDGDEVGVPTPWEWPDAFEGVTADHLEEAKRRIGREPKWREDAQSSNWVGHAIGDLFGVVSGEKDGRNKLKSILKGWIASGALRVVEAPDDMRHMRRWVVVGD